MLLRGVTGRYELLKDGGGLKTAAPSLSTAGRGGGRKETLLKKGGGVCAEGENYPTDFNM